MPSSKKNIIITLDAVDIPSLHNSRNNRHILTLELIWPRMSIAKKVTTLTVPLMRGRCDTACWSWTNKVCFKEAVEGPFGLNLSVSEPLTVASARKFIRYFAGKTAQLAADAAEDAVPVPVLNDMAGLPLMYLAKELLADADPDAIAVGAFDLTPDMAGASAQQFTVPLIASKARRDSNGRAIVRKNQSNGTAVFSIVEY